MLERLPVLSVEYVGSKSKPPLPDLYRLELFAREGRTLVLWLEEDPDVLPLPGTLCWVEWEHIGDAVLGQEKRVGVTLYTQLEGTGQSFEYTWRLGRRALLLPSKMVQKEGQGTRYGGHAA